MTPPKITPFLMFADRLEEAVKRYTRIFEKYGAKITRLEGKDGKSAEFELAGQRFLAYEGGPYFSFSNGLSLFIACDTQEEIDELYARLLEDGGSEQACGWVTDTYGVSWQVVPRILGDLLGSADREKAGRAMEAMLKMKKLDIAALQKAYDGS